MAASLDKIHNPQRPRHTLLSSQYSVQLPHLQWAATAMVNRKNKKTKAGKKQEEAIARVCINLNIKDTCKEHMYRHVRTIVNYEWASIFVGLFFLPHLN